MAAPKGNKNASNGARWRNTLRRALATYSGDGVSQGRALSKIAETVVKLAIAGDKDAISEIANRLDGRPTQPLEHTGKVGIVEMLQHIGDTDHASQDEQRPH